MKKITALSLSTASFFTIALPAFAQGTGTNKAGGLPNNINPCPAGTQFSTLCNLNFTGGVVGALITVAFIVAALIALGFLIFGGIKWITSGGDKAGVEGARNTIVAALVGLVIVFLAYFLIRLIFTFFGLTFDNFAIPNITGK